MKIYSNDKLIKRNKTIGNVLSLGSIAILGTGMFLSFKDNDGEISALHICGINLSVSCFFRLGIITCLGGGNLLDQTKNSRKL